MQPEVARNLDQLTMFGSWKALTRKRMEAGKEMKVGFSFRLFSNVTLPMTNPCPKNFGEGIQNKTKCKLHSHQIIIVIRYPPIVFHHGESDRKKDK